MLDHGGVPARRRLQKVCGDRVRVRKGASEDARRSGMTVGSGEPGQVGIDRRTDQRMHERQTTFVTEDLNPDERVNQPYRLSVVQLGKFSGMPELDIATVDRDRPRESYCARSQVGQSMQDRLLHTVQPDGRQRRHGRARRLDLVASEGCCEFDDEERVSAGRRMNGGNEGWIGRGAQVTTQYGRHPALG